MELAMIVNVLCWVFGVLLVLALVGLVVASYMLNRTVWQWCPRCQHYHNDHVGIVRRRPEHGTISGVESLCAVCRPDEVIQRKDAMQTKRGWIGVDLDGTLAHYDGWKGIEHIGEPIPQMVARVKRWLREGRTVKIFTARVDGGEVALSMGDANGVQARDVAAVRRHIETWCQRHIGQVLPITNVKDYGMYEIWDDRAKQVVPNTGMAVEDQVKSLKVALCGQAD
jgi:hypothetical protein